MRGNLTHPVDMQAALLTAGGGPEDADDWRLGAPLG
jgi:hypothetical protein